MADKVLVVMPLSEWSVGDVRIRYPLGRLGELKPGKWEIVVKGVVDLVPEDFAHVSAVVLQRLSSAFAGRLAKRLKQRGVPLVFEIDDLLWEIPGGLESAEPCRRKAGLLKQMLRQSDAITTSVPALAEELREFNADVTVIPNAIPRFESASRLIESEKPTIVLAASDYMSISDGLLKALRLLQRDGGIRIVVFGPTAKRLIAAELTVEVREVCSLVTFQRQLAELGNATAILPMEDSRFAKCKSPVKFWSFAEARMPMVVRDLGPYSGIARHDENAWCVEADDFDCWIKGIRVVVGDANRRKRFVDRATSDLPGIDTSAECWDGLLDRVCVHSSVGADFTLPNAFEWRMLKFPFMISKWRSFLRQTRSGGLVNAMRTLRKSQ